MMHPEDLIWFSRDEKKRQMMQDGDKYLKQTGCAHPASPHPHHNWIL